MKFRQSIVIFAMLILCWPIMAIAKTNIFGEGPGNHKFTMSIGSDVAVLGWMWTPVEQFSWGFRLSGVLTNAADQSAAKWDTTIMGIGIEYPLIDFGSVFDQVPINGVGFMAVSIDIDVENDYAAYVPIEVGFDIVFNEHVFFRTVKPLTELNTGNTLPAPDIRFGVKVVW